VDIPDVLQLAMAPTHRRPLQVRYHVSCDALQRTVIRSSRRSTHAESGTGTSAQPITASHNTPYNSHLVSSYRIYAGSAMMWGKPLDPFPFFGWLLNKKAARLRLIYR